MTDTMTDERMVTISRSALNELRGEVASLHARVDEISAELDQRDSEQLGVEGMLEYLESTTKTLRWALGGLIKSTIGTRDDKYGGRTLHHALYPDPHEAGFRQAGITIWRRPARRWSQFGSLAELRALAAQYGVTYRSGASREYIIRAIWSHRWPRDILPGAVGPYSSRDLLNHQFPTNAGELNRTEQPERPIGTPRQGPAPTYD